MTRSGWPASPSWSIGYSKFVALVRLRGGARLTASRRRATCARGCDAQENESHSRSDRDRKQQQGLADQLEKRRRENERREREIQRICEQDPGLRELQEKLKVRARARGGGGRRRGAVGLGGAAGLALGPPR